MADYYPLLARALDALPDRAPGLRKAVYERARTALMGQLRSIVPPLSEADIGRERDALEAAIARLEVDHGGQPPAEAPGPLPQPPAPPRPEPLPEAVLPPAVEVPLSPTKGIGSREAPPREPLAAAPAEPSASVIPLATRAPKPSPAKPPATEADRIVAEQEAAPSADGSISSQADGTGGRQRPRIDVVAPRRSNARMLRNVFVGSVLALVIGLIATAAYLLRDKPTDLQPIAGAGQTAPAEGTETKYADRLGGDAPAAPDRAAPAPAQTATPPAGLPSQPEVAVAQRAVLIEEVPNASPRITQGRVVWRLDAISGERGQPLETAVHATMDFPDAGISLSMTLRRNLDTTLPASHTIELAFTNTEPNGAARTVQDVGLIHAKDDENARGSPLSGLPVRVRENLFLIGLSSLTSDVERNSDLLLQKNWFDLAIKYAAGPRAVISFEKGSSGIQIMQSAFDQWRS